MVKNCFHWSFASDFQHQRATIKSILEFIENELPNLSENVLFDLRVILNELVKNAIIHGHNMDKTKKVDLSIELDDEAITACIRDEGEGFDYSHLFVTAGPPDNIFNEHGWGLQLVLNLVDNVAWNSLGNEVVFCKSINGINSYH